MSVNGMPLFQGNFIYLHLDRLNAQFVITLLGNIKI